MTTTADEGARVLRVARDSGALLTRFTADEPELDAAWGLAVQDRDREARVAAGEWVVGFKLGLTSAAKQRTMQVHEPIVGFLTDVMQVVDTALLTQPRVEPELAFVLARELDGPIALAEVPSYVDGVALALEVLDSRYGGYAFGHADVLADNTSAAGFLLGDVHPLATLPVLAGVTATWEVSGRPPETVRADAILGDPLRALVHLSEHLAARGLVAPAGSVVLAGAMTDAVPLPAAVRLVHPLLGEVTHR